jgi:hypothetical protein
VAGFKGLAAHPLLKFRGGTPPTPPAMGASPPWTPLYPPPLAEGSPAFWVPFVAGLQELAARPLLWNFGGTSPMPSGRGLRPCHPRFSGRGVAPLRSYLAEADLWPEGLVSSGMKGSKQREAH